MKEEDREEDQKKVLIAESDKDKAVKTNPIKEYLNKKDWSFSLSFPGRIILTLYTFHGFFFICNIIIQYIILIPGLLFEIEAKGVKIFLSIIYIIFTISSTNLLVIPAYVFLTFPFLLYANPFDHLISFKYIFQEKEYNRDEIDKKKTSQFINLLINIAIIIFEIAYLTGLFLGFASVTIKVKDMIKVVVLFFIYFYYLSIFLCYFVLSMYLIYKIILKNFKNLFKEKFTKNVINQINEYFKNKPKLPDINLASYVINPFVMKNYTNNKNEVQKINNNNEIYFEDIVFSLGLIIKFFLLMISLIGFIIIFISIVKSDFISGVLFILLFIIMITLSLSLNFPICYRNRKTFGSFFAPKYFLQVKHPVIVSISRLFFDAIIILVSVLLLILYYNVSDTDQIVIQNKFDKLIPSEETIDTKRLLLPTICYSSIHNIPLMLYMPFINDAYDYNNDHEEEYSKGEYGPFIDSYLQINNYRRLFFNSDYHIDVKGNLIDNEITKAKGVKMVQYNVKTGKNKITILSIKGTSYKKDMYLDFQLYFSSVLLNLLSTFSILATKDSYSFRFIEYSLSIPYRLFFKHLLVEEYLTKLMDAFYENEKKFYNNVVIVGHSLGGGLAKLLGRLLNKQAISLSGPGVNAFHSLWKYEGESENFEISAVDLVPDMDLVPRVETSGGTIYRIICKKGVAKCHKSVYSLCEVLIMCRNPNYKVYCENLAEFSDNDIKDIYESSKLNENDK